MGSRLELHEMLVSILGSRNVYYQPPESIKINYPAIVYSKSDIKNRFASDEVYNQSNHYTLTVIDLVPDSKVLDKISKLPKVKFDRHFTSDNLNHDVFSIYY